jgi:hypothetical protein
LQGALKIFSCDHNAHFVLGPTAEKYSHLADINSQFCTDLQKNARLAAACNNCDTEALKIAP